MTCWRARPPRACRRAVRGRDGGRALKSCRTAARCSGVEGAQLGAQRPRQLSRGDTARSSRAAARVVARWPARPSHRAVARGAHRSRHAPARAAGARVTRRSRHLGDELVHADAARYPRCRAASGSTFGGTPKSTERRLRAGTGRPAFLRHGGQQAQCTASSSASAAGGEHQARDRRSVARGNARAARRARQTLAASSAAGASVRLTMSERDFGAMQRQRQRRVMGETPISATAGAGPAR